MKKAIFTSVFVTLISFSSLAQNLQLTYQYSLCDVFYIQDKDADNSSCITASTKTGGEPGYTKTVEEYEKPSIVFSPGGIPPKIKREVEVPSTEYSYRVFTNTCTEYASVKAIRKVRLTTGQIMYEDATFLVKPGETTQQKNIQYYVNNYNSENAEIGSTIAYKNPLNLDSDTYNTYLNSVINSDEGTLVVTPTSRCTRIYLNPGDKVIINAEGSIRLGSFAGYGGPNGINGFSNYSFTSNARHGALVYYHPDVHDWYFMGSKNTFTASKKGFLWLSVNDNSKDDDEGQFIVNYEIIRANSTSASVFNSLPQSCADLEKLATFNKKELDTYLANNNFTRAIENDGMQFFLREKDGVKLIFGYKIDYSTHETSLAFASGSKERYLKIKNSLSAEGYVYTKKQEQFDMYKKTTKASQSSIDTEVSLGMVNNLYTVVIKTPNN